MQQEPAPQEKEASPYSRWERRGSAIAHASGLLVGLPFFLLLHQPVIAFLANPVLAYFIGKYLFRRRRLAWGAFQCIQAAVVHLIIVMLLFIAWVVGLSVPMLTAVLFTVAALLFLYTLWGAWDTLLGYNFRYIVIGNFLDRVSQANLQRMERRRDFSRTEQDNKPQR